MRHTMVAGVVLAALGGLVPEAKAGFAFDSSVYAEGERLSEKGCANGSWSVPGGEAVPTRDAGRGIAINSSGGVSFTADAEPDGPSATYDFTFSCEGLISSVPEEIPAGERACLCPYEFSDGTTGLCALGDGRWQGLVAEGVSLAPHETIECRVEMREQAGDAFVSYLVKKDAAWVRLATQAGRAWFRAGVSSSDVRVATFAGAGHVASFAGAEGAGSERRTLYWIGGASGDWSSAANWSLTAGGDSADVVPSFGDIAVVPGKVTLADGKDSASVQDLTVEVAEDGAKEILGGTLSVEPTVDLTRPRAGKALTVTCPSGIFNERYDNIAYTWTRGDAKATWEAEPVSVKASFTPTAADYGHWFRLQAEIGGETKLDTRFYFSRLPVLYMTTDDGLTPTPAKEEHAGHIFVQGNDEWKSLYDGAMTIKVRGNSTKNYPKKPWKLKLDKKTAMFGIEKSKHWVLLANYNDMSQLRGKLAADLANDIGSLGMESTWVECILNGEPQGLYQFMEHIRIDPARVPVYDWEDQAKSYGATDTDFSAIDDALEADPGSIDISGGYLFEFSEEYDEVSKFTTYAGKLEMRTMLNKPEFLYTSTNMMNWCKGYLQQYWDAVTSPTRMSDGRHYSEYADLDSMVAYWLVNELFANNDATKKSRYAYIDRGGKLFFGPVWDFDWGCGSVVVTSKAEYWACAKDNGGDRSRKYGFMKEWASDDCFCRKLYKRYWEIRERYEEVFKDGGLIDTYAPQLAEAGEVNDALWPRSRTAAEDRAILKDYLARRAVWLDKQFASVETLMASLKCDIQSAQSNWDPDATRPASGEVPEIGLEWVREMLEPADVSYAYASAEKLSDAVTSVPTPWGKTTPLWQDYIAGTDPDPKGTNATLRITGFSVVDGAPVIRYSPDLGEKRRYTVLGRESLDDEAGWHEQREGDRFFKVKVSMPE